MRCDEVAGVGGHFPRFLVRLPRIHPHHLPETLPPLLAQNARQVAAKHILAFFNASVSAFRNSKFMVGFECLECFHGLFQQRWLVAFQAYHIVRFRINNLLYDIGLAPHGINRDGRSFKIQYFNQLRNCRYLVRLLADLQLSERHRVFGHPGADDVDGVAVVHVACLANPFPVYADELSVSTMHDGRGPFHEMGLEGLRVEVLEKASERVVGRDAVGQVEVLFKEIALIFREIRDFLPAVQSVECSYEDNEDDVFHRMEDFALLPGVFQCLKMNHDFVFHILSYFTDCEVNIRKISIQKSYNILIVNNLRKLLITFCLSDVY